MQTSQNQNFIHDDFLLESAHAKRLYHDFAAQLPIIDYHNHLPPDQIALNSSFETITPLWLEDHYKWRAMRTNGVNEHFITGKADDREKFRKWAATLPYTLRNPLYHWSRLELARYFDIYDDLSADNADMVFDQINGLLQEDEFKVQGLLSKKNVELVCTTDDPTDSLEYHRLHRSQHPQIEMRPAFRPDKAVLIEKNGFSTYISQLEKISDKPINSYSDLVECLHLRMDHFDTHFCNISDHGLNNISFAIGTQVEIDKIFSKARNHDPISDEDIAKYQTRLLLDLCKEYHRRGWIQQFHLGALRNNNKRKFGQLGPDTGWDSIGDFDQAHGLSRFLDELDSTDQLAKTIIYNLNPRDNEVFATMIGNFNDGSMPGKVQWGSAWWFLDQLDGMEKQINTLSQMGLISQFIGMLTDSRSFLSFPRHEYFRRLLCNMFGHDIQKGLLPKDYDWIGKMIQNISYYNVKNYIQTTRIV